MLQIANWISIIVFAQELGDAGTRKRHERSSHVLGSETEVVPGGSFVARLSCRHMQKLLEDRSLDPGSLPTGHSTEMKSARSVTHDVICGKIDRGPFCLAVTGNDTVLA